MKITNRLNLPEALVKAVSTERHNKPGCYSATTLLKGTRETLLTQRHWDLLEDDAGDRIWTVFGSAVHSIFEKQNDSTFKEEYFEVQVTPQTKITGRVDCYDMADSTLIDWKTSTVWKVIYKDFEDWKRQGLIYAWLMGKSGLKVKRCKFIALLKDFSKTKAKNDRSYPQSPCFVYEYEVTDRDLCEIEKFIMNKTQDIERCSAMDDESLPECTAQERWQDETKYAAMKQGRKSALKLFDAKEEAEKYISELEDKKVYLEERKGTSKKCMDYCPCRAFCSYYKTLGGEAE